MQVSKPLPILEISGDLSTDGGEGQSLVKGVQMSLKAIALSVKPGAKVSSVTVGGQVRTAGNNVISVELDGDVDRIDIAGGVIANGANSDGIHVRGDVPGLDAINVHAAHGHEVVRTD